MSTALTDISQTAPNTAPVSQLNPRQRIEALVDGVPTVGSLLAEAESSQTPGASELEEPVQRVNEVMSEYGVQFQLSEPPGERMVIRIVDSESGELIRQVPPEEVLRVAEQLDEMQAARGGLINLEA